MGTGNKSLALLPFSFCFAAFLVAACSRDVASAAPDAETPSNPADGGDAGARSDAELTDARALTPPPLPGCSLAGPGVSSCGPDGGESCCASPSIEGGAFVVRGDGTGAAPPPVAGKVSSFRLDRFEVTGGRFRRFVGAVEAGWSPAAGSGKHGHLSGGQGLTRKASGFESGWVPDWTSSLATTRAGWTANLSCPYGTWTDAPGDRETLPINCVTWYEAYAFCIWDGGFLPSMAERSFAAVGGSEQRMFPWSSPPSSSTIDCEHLNYGGGNFPQTACVGAGLLGVRHTSPVGSRSPLGDGRWGHADLAGNVTEWVLDKNGVPPDPCIDCYVETPTVNAPSISHFSYGGDFTNVIPAQFGSFGRPQTPGSRASWIGLRCAREP